MSNKRHHVKDFTQHIKNICNLLHTPILEVAEGDKKRRNVVSLITLHTHTVRVESYAMYTTEELSEHEAERLKLTFINAEEYFIDHNKLWVGDIKKVFTDYSITLENKCGSLVWCGTPYRSTMEEFYVDCNQPIMVSNYHIAALTRLSTGKGISDLAQLSVSTDEQTRSVMKSLESINSKVNNNAHGTVFTGISAGATVSVSGDITRREYIDVAQQIEQ